MQKCPKCKADIRTVCPFCNPSDADVPKEKPAKKPKTDE